MKRTLIKSPFPSLAETARTLGVSLAKAKRIKKQVHSTLTRKPTINKYRCPACKKVVLRDDNAVRHKSFCETTGKVVWMTKVKTK